MIIRARTILPVSRPPIENGAVWISKNQIIRIGRWTEFSGEISGEKIFDFGEVILLPGLVNAHCHLDYTDMAGQLPPPKTFLDWIPLMLAAKSAWGYSEYAQSWLHGAHMLLKTGTTTVADIEAVPELLPEMWNSTALRVFSFLEMTGIRARRDPVDILNETVEKIDSLTHTRSSAAFSPHAPYSTLPELLQLCAKVARKKKLRVTTHVAESTQEFEMFTHARGKMFDWMQRNQRDNSDCGRGSSVQHLERAGILSKNFMAVHANYLVKKDVGLLAKRNASVVHCPRSHSYFQHEPFPLQKLSKAKVNICLGTDSLSTVRKTGKQKLELNMFDEMRLLANNDKTIPPAEILRMATLNGARALGLTGKIGELSKSAFADLISIPFEGKTSEAAAAAVNFSGRISASMIGGEWAIPPDV